MPRNPGSSSGTSASPLLSGLLLTGLPLVVAYAQGIPAVPPPAADPHAVFVAEAAQRFRLPEHWIRAVRYVESGGDVRALSSAGAMGLMQVMPDTWADLRVRHRLGNDPFDPRDNILAGTAYLREMHDRFGSPGFLAAYNAGPRRYEDYLAGAPLPAETRAYVAKLTPLVGVSDVAPGPLDDATLAATDPNAWRRARLFSVRSDGKSTVASSQFKGARDATPAAPPAGDSRGIIPQPDGLFVTRSVPRGLQ
ncbi:lytic transglycosylase domain-containing protein [Tianweitania sp. Rool2]|uniref:Lytic transglycosylase domain-containing protein n=1 Tax=Oryzicola mucosus TaxID=2767425 RepID=A0A8J6U9F2_9HYPH|nr:lytic transglycosylase domain-containing protein [Oryzicola mucosus]